MSVNAALVFVRQSLAVEDSQWTVGVGVPETGFGEAVSVTWVPFTNFTMPPLAAGSLVMLTEPGAVGHEVDVSVVCVSDFWVVENSCPLPTGVPVQRTPVQSFDSTPLGQPGGVVAKIRTVIH